MLGHQPPRRLVAPNPAEMRRHPHRPADIGAIVAGHDPACHCGRAAARRSAGRAVVVVRVERAAIDGVHALPVGQVNGHIGLADDDRACRLQPPHKQGIARRDFVAIGAVPPSCRKPRHIEAFLDRHRHAEQRLVEPARRGIHRLGGFACTGKIGHGNRIDFGVVLARAGDRGIDRFDHAELARPDRQRGGERAGFGGQLRIGHAAPLGLSGRGCNGSAWQATA